MEITTNLSRFDYLLLNIHLAIRSKAVWLIGFFIWVSQFYSTYSGLERSEDVVCTVCTIFAAFVAATIGATLIMLALVSFGILVSVFLANFTPGVLCEHKFVLRDDGLFESTEVNETLTRWKGIGSIKKYKKGIIVWIGIGVHSIPRKYFDSQEQYEEFGSQLYERWKTHV